MAIFHPEVKLKFYQTTFNRLFPLDSSKDVRPGAMGIHFDKVMPWLVKPAITHDLNDDLIRLKLSPMTYKENDDQFNAVAKEAFKAYPFKNALTRELGHMSTYSTYAVIRAYRNLRGENEVDKAILAARQNTL